MDMESMHTFFMEFAKETFEKTNIKIESVCFIWSNNSTFSSKPNFTLVKVNIETTLQK